MTEALGRASDKQIDEIVVLLVASARTVEKMKGSTPKERMALAETYTSLNQQVNLLWLPMIGMGIKMVVTPEGDSKAVAYSVESGEPMMGTMEVHAFGERRK